MSCISEEEFLLIKRISTHIPNPTAEGVKARIRELTCLALSSEFELM